MLIWVFSFFLWLDFCADNAFIDRADIKQYIDLCARIILTDSGTWMRD